MGNPKQKALIRAELIMKVRCGLMTAAAAAKHLGVSRRTYYKWEQRGLSALLDALADQSPGRPEKRADPKQTVLENQLSQLKRDNALLEQKLILKDLATDFHICSPKERKKKK